MIPSRCTACWFAFVLSLIILLITAGTVFGQQPARPDPERQLRRMDSVNREAGERRKRHVRQEEDEDPSGRDDWFYFQRAFPYDLIPAGARHKALEQMRQMQLQLDMARAKQKGGAGIQAASTWSLIGPENGGGRVRALATRPDGIFLSIGAAAGGVWHTFDGGATWSTHFDKQGSLAMGALAVDFVAPDTMYAGTGENSSNVDAYSGEGVFRTTNAGATWESMGLSTVGSFSKMFVHRQNHAIVYAAATKSGAGFYRSTDFGVTWTKMPVSGSFYDMSVNPQNSDEIYLSSANSILRSTDAGQNFSTITSGITTSNGLRISVCVAPSSPSTVWALVARTGAPSNRHFGDVYVSTNKGTTWTKKMSFDDGSFFREQGWYDNFITVSPVDPSIVLIGGIDVFRTSDGGTTWSNVTRSYTGGNVHPDQHTAVFETTEPEIVYLGNDGGVYMSLDAGITWSLISGRLPITQFYAMDVDQTRPYRAYGGTQDNGSYGTFGTSAFSTQWKSILGGDGFYTVVSPADPNYVYAENYNGTPIYSIDLTVPSTPHWQRIEDNSMEEAAWSAPLAVSPVDKVSLYSGRQRLWRTRNEGATWTTLNTNSSAPISAIGLSPLDANKLMIGTAGGEVRASTDFGVTWVTTTGVPGRVIGSIRYDPVEKNRVYLTTMGFGGSHVMRSDNSGTSFTNVSQTLPDVPTSSVEIDPQNNQHLFAATDIGVFYSPDAGASWFPFNDGLPVSPVIDFRIQRSSRTLVAATHGRSMWRVSIDNPAIPPVLIYPTGGESVASPGSLTVRWAGLSVPLRVSISYDGGATYSVAADNVMFASATIDLPYIRTTRARIKVEEIGSGRVVTSDNFTITPAINATELGSRGFVAEALTVRNGELWATVRDSAVMYRMRLPLLTNKTSLQRTGINGVVRDMDYDAVGDVIYVLTSDADNSNARLYKMDSTGAMISEVTPLPVTTISGVAITTQGIVLVTPGAQGKFYVLDRTSGSVLSQSDPMTNSGGNDRRGLVWDGGGFVQGVVGRLQAPDFESELQRISSAQAPTMFGIAPVVLNNTPSLQFFGLTFDGSNGDPNLRTFWASDTAGKIYRLAYGGVFGDVKNEYISTVHSSSIAILDVTPHPIHTQSVVHFALKSRQHITVGLYNTTGQQVRSFAQETLEQGDHRTTINTLGLASGVYYLTISSAEGDRAVTSVVVVQ